MADFSFWDLFETPQVVEVMKNVQVRALETRDEIEKAALFRWSVDFRNDLNALAETVATRVDEHIRRVLEAERKRPPTDKTRHLSDNIQSHSPQGLGAIGVVGVADIAELDRTTNPNGGSDRPYWLVIEEGSAAIQPEMRGRQLFGSFVGPGGESAPSQDAFREDSSFVFGRGSGRGVIEREIEPQRFLARGTDEGWKDYLSAINALQATYSKRLAEIRRGTTIRAAGIVLPRG